MSQWSYSWNEDKNEILKQERGASFELVESLIESGALLHVYDILISLDIQARRSS